MEEYCDPPFQDFRRDQVVDMAEVMIKALRFRPDPAPGVPPDHVGVDTRLAGKTLDADGEEIGTIEVELLAGIVVNMMAIVCQVSGAPFEQVLEQLKEHAMYHCPDTESAVVRTRDPMPRANGTSRIELILPNYMTGIARMTADDRAKLLTELVRAYCATCGRLHDACVCHN